MPVLAVKVVGEWATPEDAAFLEERLLRRSNPTRAEAGLTASSRAWWSRSSRRASARNWSELEPVA